MKTSAAAYVLLGAIALPAAVAAQPVGSAQAHYTAGSQLYAAGRFADAAAAFERAYQVSQRAELLFNIARAYEDARDDARALDAYDRFERSGAPGIDRALVLQRVAALRVRIASRPVAAAPSPPPPPAPPSPDLTGPIVVLASGGAALLGAVPLWLTALGDFNELDRRCPARQCRSPADLDLRDSAATRALVGDVLGGVGAVALVAGTTWLVVSLSSPSRTPTATTPRAAVWCGATGCRATVGWGF